MERDIAAEQISTVFSIQSTLCMTGDIGKESVFSKFLPRSEARGLFHPKLRSTTNAVWPEAQSGRTKVDLRDSGLKLTLFLDLLRMFVRDPHSSIW
ncbi:unnamed protein product [Protopolystoma xenopodis]|uniref:Uncharacterized protein n=1 Tax=Protopolystoma xenopodis TaxID=117903 RepID=A0A3S5B6Y1_9PLAT|nr:unnamed protein product [Protopolystoma xenopodis]